MFCDNCQDFWRIAFLEKRKYREIIVITADDMRENLSIKENNLTGRLKEALLIKIWNLQEVLPEEANEISSYVSLKDLSKFQMGNCNEEGRRKRLV